MNDKGTFLFPPASYENLASYAHFWAAVPISDGILSNIILGYADRVRQQADSSGLQWSFRYDAKNSSALHSTSPNRKAKAEADRADAFADHMAKFYETHPVRIPADSARAIARAGQAAYYCYVLTQEEIDELADSTVTVGGTDMSIDDVTGFYLLNEIRGSFQDPQVTTAERLEDVRLELRTIRGL